MNIFLLHKIRCSSDDVLPVMLPYTTFFHLFFFLRHYCLELQMSEWCIWIIRKMVNHRHAICFLQNRDNLCNLASCVNYVVYWLVNTYKSEVPTQLIDFTCRLVNWSVHNLTINVPTYWYVLVRVYRVDNYCALSYSDLIRIYAEICYIVIFY